MARTTASTLGGTEPRRNIGRPEDDGRPLLPSKPSTAGGFSLRGRATTVLLSSRAGAS
jgi:hypothetical protein